MSDLCANCRKEPGIVAVPYRDVAPTDRGDQVREGTEWWCSECFEEEHPREREEDDNTAERDWERQQYRNADRDEWRHEAAEQQRLK